MLRWHRRLASVLTLVTYFTVAGCGPRIIREAAPSPESLQLAAEVLGEIARDSASVVVVVDGRITDGAALNRIPSEEVMAVAEVELSDCGSVSPGPCRVYRIWRCGTRTSGIDGKGDFVSIAAPCPWRLRP